MKAKIAIHHKNGTFSDRWIEYCETNNISYRLVNCHANNIIRELGDCCALLWHWQHYVHKDVLVAKQIISAVETMGLKVFPSSSTCESFDNKIAQKYQLESINAPLVITYVFFDRDTAINWANKISYPKVFKLSKGAGAMNVKLVRNKNNARKLIDRAFRKGFKQITGRFAENLSKMYSPQTRKQVNFFGKVKRLPSILRNIQFQNRMFGREIGYAYFQDFIPENQYDIRITVIGNRAFGFGRKNREGDFRASGSGEIVYDKGLIDSKYIEVAFDVTKKIGAQSLAFDFLKGADGRPKITEISYCYLSSAVHMCPGFWDEKIIWHEGHIQPEDAILMDLIKSACSKEKQFLSHST